MANNCVITSGLTLNSCVNNIAGISDLWVLTTTGTSISLASITYTGTSGTVSDLSGTTVGVFKKIDLVRNSAAVLSESVNVVTASLSFTFVPSLQFMIPGWNQVYTDLYEELVKSIGTVFIVKLKSGKYFLVSPSGMYISAATIASGSVPGDSQMYDLTFVGEEIISIPQMDVTSTLSAFLSGSNLTVDRE
jgi:hypothetical protein